MTQFAGNLVKANEPAKAARKSRLKGGCMVLTHLMLLPLKRPLTIVDHTARAKGRFPVDFWRLLLASVILRKERSKGDKQPTFFKLRYPLSSS
jgi:hypothetical protein